MLWSKKYRPKNLLEIKHNFSNIEVFSRYNFNYPVNFIIYGAPKTGKKVLADCIAKKILNVSELHYKPYLLVLKNKEYYINKGSQNYFIDLKLFIEYDTSIYDNFIKPICKTNNVTGKLHLFIIYNLQFANPWLIKNFKCCLDKYSESSRFIFISGTLQKNIINDFCTHIKMSKISTFEKNTIFKDIIEKEGLTNIKKSFLEKINKLDLNIGIDLLKVHSIDNNLSNKFIERYNLRYYQLIEIIFTKKFSNILKLRQELQYLLLINIRPQVIINSIISILSELDFENNIMYE